MKKGGVTTPDGLYIEAINFEYNKITNILKVKGNIKFVDKEKHENFLIKRHI